jgi:molybdopterin converting factor small subunit
MWSVTVRHFAQLRELRGCDQERVEFQPGTTMADLYAQIFASTAGEHLPVGYALAHEIVGGNTPLVDGAEVAFLPPVGGG